MNDQFDHENFDPETASIEELREHIARKRSAIDANLGELERRVQPDYIAEHLVERGRELLTGQSGSFVREFGNIARENPLGTALTCFGLALLAKGYLDANNGGSSSVGDGQLRAHRASSVDRGDADSNFDPDMAMDQSEIRRQLKNEHHYVPSYSSVNGPNRTSDDDHMDKMFKGAALAAGIGVAVGGYVAYSRREVEPVE
ncbi:hypothetical protein [Allohahella sp. A8]|uniref:hypothetical protein n=1 Tax=Allohahella sp. A8 TaxID=3141461 RepID=UPI000C0AD689|nr:hypothetical protein [Hahellaceae bacterium]|tara:strand:+ start:72858 stop:73460 length:603 start_codon:yes stop_codon:yes gene_type:complete